MKLYSIPIARKKMMQKKHTLTIWIEKSNMKKKNLIRPKNEQY